jgi:hypothetical protein
VYQKDIGQLIKYFEKGRVQDSLQLSTIIQKSNNSYGFFCSMHTEKRKEEAGYLRQEETGGGTNFKRKETTSVSSIETRREMWILSELLQTFSTQTVQQSDIRG